MVFATSDTRPAGRRPRRTALLRAAAVLAVLLLGGSAYALAYGHASPYSPVLPGFTRHELPHLVVCAEQGASWEDLRHLDTVTAAVEQAHGLRFTGKPRLLVYRDRASYLRHVPTRARFCAFYNGTVVVSPWAQQEAAAGKISLPVYLRHELSHVLMLQHMGPLAALRFPKWLLEGLATYTAGQRGTSFYPDRAATYRLVSEGNFLPPQVYKRRGEDAVTLHVPNRFPFMYSQFACLVEYLLQTRGQERFADLLCSLMAGEHQEGAFARVYGCSLDSLVQEFRAYAVQQGQAGTEGLQEVTDSLITPPARGGAGTAPRRPATAH